jgi:hypothetical protein
MSDPKLPNFGTYVRTIFRQFHPHLDPTYPFRPISVRIIEQTSVSMKSVRITSDAEVQFSPVLREFLRTVNWTYGSVQPTV